MLSFKIKETVIRLSYLPFALLFISLSLDTSRIAVFAVIASLCHELGHIAAILLLRVRLDTITIHAFGVKIGSISGLGRGERYIVLISGSLTNILAAILVYITFPQSGLFAAVSCVCGLFSLLPIGTLDGGQMLALFLDEHFSERTAVIIGTIVSSLFLLPLSAAGFFILCVQKGNYSLLVLSVCMIFLMLKAPSKNL